MSKITIVAAMSENRCIGKSDTLPWRIKLPGELKIYRAYTLGKPLIMGRKTFESIGKPLPGRRNIILTRDTGSLSSGLQEHINTGDVEAFGELDTALLSCQNNDEIIINGGAQIYKQALEAGIVTHIRMTHVDGQYDGDTFFPTFEENFTEVSRKKYDGYSIIMYERSA